MVYFKDLILYYHILFSIIVILGYLIASKIDQSFGKDLDVG